MFMINRGASILNKDTSYKILITVFYNIDSFILNIHVGISISDANIYILLTIVF